MKRNAAILCLLVLPLAGGCATVQVRTDDPVTFLRLQLLQAPPAQSDTGWYADYVGKEGAFHVMKLRWSNFMKLRYLWEGQFQEETCRCPIDSLGAGYPLDLARDLAAQKPRYWNDLLKPTGYYWSVRDEIANEAIRQYLQKHGKLTPELKRKLAQEAK